MEKIAVTTPDQRAKRVSEILLATTVPRSSGTSGDSCLTKDVGILLPGGRTFSARSRVA